MAFVGALLRIVQCVSAPIMVITYREVYCKVAAAFILSTLISDTSSGRLKFTLV